MFSKFWVNNVYSLGYWLKDYACYPKWLPLFNYMDHGIPIYDSVPVHEIENDAPLIFRFSPRLVAEYKKVSKKPVYCIISPTIHYRIKKDIKQNKDAKGTLFFLAHSTPTIDDLTNWDEFINSLNKIEHEFKPVDICLHYHDMVKGLDNAFTQKGYKVVSVGNPYSDNYVQNFYNILRNYKFTMSNIIGSYTFYSVELGIPFSLYGKEPKYFNKGDRNVEAGTYASYKKYPTYQKAFELFKGYHTHISQAQLEFVETELGKKNSIGRIRACFLLYKSLIVYMITQPRELENILIKVLRSAKQRVWNNKLKKMIRPIYNSFTLHKLNDYKLVLKKDLTRKELYRLKYGKQKQIRTSLFKGKEIQITDAFWYLHSLNELFLEETYKFKSSTDSPLIIDCGSNVGLSIIYFKQLFPKSKVIGFEPDKEIFNMLTHNIRQFDLKNIDLHQKAVWINYEPLLFQQNGSLGGHLTSLEGSNTIKINTQRLKDILIQKIDFLKIDIEGAEFEILKDCEGRLSNIENIFIEYHSFHEKEQMIGELLIILKKAGFKIYIKEAWENMKKPYIEKKGPYFDLQINIFGYRR